MQNITSWTEAFMAAFASAMSMFAGALPKILAFLVIVIIGWLIASGVSKAIAIVLRKLKFNTVADKAGLDKFMGNAGLSNDASGKLAMVVKWFVRLIALVAAFNALGLPAVSEILNQLLLWLPNLFVALAIVVIGGWGANAVAAIVRGMGTSAQSTHPEFLVRLAKTAVWLFTGIVAFNQLGVATEIVQTLFSAIVGAIALGAALAFGLGGKEVAGEMLRKWHDKCCDSKCDK